jgi:hypothetical protein
VLPLGLGFDRAVASGFRTLAQLNIGYRHSPAVQEGRPGLRRGPRAGDRLPDAASPGTARTAGWVRPWPGRASICCCAARPATGTPASSPRWASATPTRWRCTTTT